MEMPNRTDVDQKQLLIKGQEELRRIENAKRFVKKACFFWNYFGICEKISKRQKLQKK